MRSEASHPTRRSCFGWRGTADCLPLGARRPEADLTCQQMVTQGSGYCECSGGAVAMPMTCTNARRPFRCEHECQQLNATSGSLLRRTHAYIAGLDGGGLGAAAEAPRAMQIPPAATCAARSPRGGAPGREGGRAPPAAGLSFSAALPDLLEWEMTEALEARVLDVAAAARAERRRHALERAAEDGGAGAAEDDEPAPRAGARSPGGEEASLHGLWRAIDAAFVAGGGLGEVRPPWAMRRDEGFDFVSKGMRLNTADVERANAQLESFLALAPAYPARKFEGAGVVVGGGGLKWMAPAVASIALLRRSGCQLPVELWVPEAEALTADFERELLALGVVARSLDAELQGAITRGPFRKYAMKPAAMLFSRFERLLWLDSDNFALRDPEGAVFGSEAFAETGMVLWPDYWAPSWAPDLLGVLGLSEDEAPAVTHESGQVAVDKSRHWDSLLAALFFNLQPHLFYPLLTDFMGMGDKETFAWGAATVGKRYSLAPTPVGSAGTQNAGIVAGMIPAQRLSPELSACMFRGNTMVQFDPDAPALAEGHSALDYASSALFFHTNYGDKAQFRLPGDLRAYSRRWRRFMPGDHSLADVRAALGYDPEKVVFDALRLTRCASFFEDYRMVRQNRYDDDVPVDMDGHSFHPNADGMNFAWWAMSGERGPFENMTACPMARLARSRDAAQSRQATDSAMASYLAATNGIDAVADPGAVDIAHEEMQMLLALPAHMTAKLNAANPYVRQLGNKPVRRPAKHDGTGDARAPLEHGVDRHWLQGGYKQPTAAGAREGGGGPGDGGTART